MAEIERAGSEVEQIAAEILREHYPELVEHKVTFDFWFATATKDKDTGEPKGPPLKLHGYPAAAVVKINSLKARQKGGADVDVEIDGDAWPDLSEGRKRALIHHEIHHVELFLNEEDGSVVLDAALRPKLKLILHDIQIGGFARIAELYGDDAYEVELVKRLVDANGQLLLPWAAHEAVAEEVA